MEAYVVGVDLGGTQIRAGLVDATGRVLRRRRTLTRGEEGPDAVIDRMVHLIREVMAGEPASVRGIGVASPGPIDPRSGGVRFAPNLPGWRDIPLKARLEQRLGLPVVVGNDANLAALAEHHFGAGRGIRDMIYITVSTGIGGGILVDGHLLVGHHGYGAEIGHQTVEDAGPRCKCGNVGCLEAMASGTAIAREGRIAVASGEPTRLAELCEGDVWRVDARMVAEAARAGDAVAREIYRRAGHYLGVGIVNLMHIFNPQRIILGGSVMKAKDLLMPAMWEVIRTRAWPVVQEDFDVVEAALGDDVGILGAAALALREV